MTLDTPNLASKQTAIALSPELLAAAEAMAKAKYGGRGFARWTEEQLQAVLADRNFLARYATSEPKGDLVRKAIRLTRVSEQLIADGILRVRKIYPLGKGEQSRILRAAMQYALERAEAKKAAVAPSKRLPGDVELQIPLEGVKPRLARRPKATRTR